MLSTLYQAAGVAGLLVAALAMCVAALTYARYAQWRKEDKTEITITQIDQRARDGVRELGASFEERARKVDTAFAALANKLDAEVEGLLNRIATGDGDTRASLQRVQSTMDLSLKKQGEQLAALAENIRHIPTQADLRNLSDEVGRLSRETGENAVGQRGMSGLLVRMDSHLQRIEEHLLK